MSAMTTTETIDSAIADLQAGERTWASMTLGDRRALLQAAITTTRETAQQWVDVAARIKQLPPSSPLVGEEWTSGPYPLLGSMHALDESLAALEAGGSPVDGFTTRDVAGGRTAVQVLPHGIFDHLLLGGFSAEVWTTPGVDAATLREKAGLGQRTPTATGGIGAVMGAGNIMSIAPLDALYELFASNRVVLLKLNPITDPMLPVFRAALAPFVDRGLIRIVTGGGDVGAEIVDHPDVAHVHITGSEKTHDVIVFGPGEAGEERRAANDPRLGKPITSELGGVSPTIVLPGEWSDRDLRYQAEHLVTQKLHNNGFNCVASQVAVISSDWAQKADFLRVLREVYDSAPARPAYYPGADDRVEAARSRHANAETLSGNRVLVPDLDRSDTTALNDEAFATVLGILELPGTGQQFLDDAVTMANEEFHGTLGVNLIAHPDTIEQLGGAFEDAIVRLRYGTVAINAWTGVGFLTARAAWGAFPGHTLDDVQSGIGVVHNAMLLDDTERTVVTGPFRPFPRSYATGQFTMTPRPPWFVTNATAAVTGRRLTDFAADPRWSALPGIFASALRG